MAKSPQKKPNNLRESASGRPRPASQSQVTPPQRRFPTAWIIGAVVGLLVIAAIFFMTRPRNAQQTSAIATAPPLTLAVKHYPSQGHQGHQPGDEKRYAHFHYNSDPPTSGYHREMFTFAFVNTSPVPKEAQVHMLEHGNILLQYNCMCPDVASQLAQIANQFDARLLPPGAATAGSQDVQNAEEQGLAVIVAPYPGMRSKIALTAWTQLATLDNVDNTQIVSFINQYLHNEDNLKQ